MNTVPTPRGASMSHVFKAAVVGMATLAATSGDPVVADSTGAHVVRGDVTFVHDGDRTIIRASDGSIISYLSFSVLPWETVQFIQPSALSRVLARITGPEATVVEGKLLANGQVYLVNPSGVVFSRDSVVNVGGLYAAAGEISDNDFINGRDRFTNLSGSVVNEGRITGSDIHLIGDRVANHGLLRSDGGIITMVAGDTVYLKRHGERITVVVDGSHLTGQEYPHGGSTTPDMLATPGVENTGVIRNNGGQVVFGAGDMYALAIRNTGHVGVSGGEVTMAATDGLVHNAGTVNVGSIDGDGGTIVMQGPSVLHEGTLRAGSRHGTAGSIEVTSQNHTYLTEGSLIAAGGGIGHADGGEVLVHSYDGLTAMARGAMVDVSGGSTGGDGGFAEVSGDRLLFNGYALLKARTGFDVGALLLDPRDITINDIGGDDGFLADGMIDFAEGGMMDSFIAAATLEAIVGVIHLQAQRTIFVDTDLNLNGNDVIFEANDSIFFNAPMTGANDLTLIADADASSEGWVRFFAPVAIDGNAMIGGTDVQFRDAGFTSGGTQTYTGHVWASTDTVIEGDAITFASMLDARPLTLVLPRVTLDGDVTFADAVGSVRQLRSLRINGNTEIAGGLVSTTEFQRYFGDVSVDADLQLLSTDGGQIRFAGAVDGANDLQLTTAGDVRFDDRVGGSTPLGAIVVDDVAGAFGTTRFAGDVDAASIDLGRPVVLGDHVEMTADTSVDFTQTVDGRGHDLVVNADDTRFGGEVFGVRLLATDARGTTTLAADVTGDRLMFGDAVTLDATALTLTGHDWIDFDSTVDSGAAPTDLTLEADEFVRFGDDVGGAGTLGSLLVEVGDADATDRNLVRIDGGLIHAIGDIDFNPAGRSGPAQVATIAASGDLRLVSDTGGIFMGLNEKLTAVGDLDLSAATTARLGDLNALGDINVDASRIELWQRGSGSLRAANGALLADLGADFVAGGSIAFSVAPTLIGSGRAPFFASFGQLNANLQSFTNFAGITLSSADFFFGSTILDLSASLSSDALATTFDEVLPVVRDVDLDPFAVRAMEQLSIYVRDLNQAELVAALEGCHLYLDCPQGGLERSGPITTASTRLRRPSVLRALEQYANLFAGAGTSETYEGGLVAADQSQHIRATLNQAWAAYGQAATDEDFRSFVMASPELTEARVYLEQLEALFGEVRTMGVTPRELRASVDTVLAPITPAAMDQNDLEAAIFTGS
ncbi:MAG: filamentous hemagglutinin N-terminal domain-containing protein [Phycisphaerae bacterium]|nr:filamentous hemagglutinin N-terminal domain-containing protein [Phycisphaerae bacterium]